MKEFWDTRYAAPIYAYGTAPNVFLMEKWAHLPATGRVLCLAEGEGRNAVFAARQGWAVVAADFSQAAREKALKWADTEGVVLENYLVADAHEWAFEPDSFDAIVLIYAHFSGDLRAQLHHKCVTWLKPGGYIILEAFNPQQLQYNSGGPKTTDMLYTKDILAQDFEGLHILEAEETEIHLEEGPYHQGLAAVVRFMAQKRQ